MAQSLSFNSIDVVKVNSKQHKCSNPIARAVHCNDYMRVTNTKPKTLQVLEFLCNNSGFLKLLALSNDMEARLAVRKNMLFKRDCY